MNNNCNTEQNCTTTITQKSINENVSFDLIEENKLRLIIGNKIYTVQLNEGGSIGGISSKIKIPITSNNQVFFSNIISLTQSISDVYLNGILQEEGNYSVTGTNLTWLDESQPLETSDSLRIEVINELEE